MAIENIGGMNMVTPKYQRVVLKLSGEALAGDAGFGIKPPVIKEIIQEIKEVHELGVEMAIVVGGGNIWRGQIAEPYIRRKAERHLEKGRIVIFAGGTGNPYFSTDTTAALRAAEIGADVILMAKNNVDGVYSADPKVDANAVKFEELTHLEVITKGLQVMDSTASSLSMDNDIPLLVFNLNEHGNIRRAILGENIGTTVRGK